MVSEEKMKRFRPVEQGRLIRRYWKSRGMAWCSLSLPGHWLQCLESVMEDTSGRIHAGLYRFKRRGDGNGWASSNRINLQREPGRERLVLVLRFERPVPVRQRRELELTLSRILRPEGGVAPAILFLRTGEALNPGMLLGKIAWEETSTSVHLRGVSRVPRNRSHP